MLMLGGPEDRPLTARETRVSDRILVVGAVVAAFTLALALVG